MNTPLRVVVTKGVNGAMNMAIDEAVLIKRKDIGMDTLRLYTWNPSAVSIGYFQSMEREVDLDFARQNGIDIVRRITGGGAVYHDAKGEVTYSIVVDAHARDMPHKIVDSYRYLSSGIIEGLKTLGINAEFAPINDIVLNGKKISGNAQTRRGRYILQHGTILYDLDAETMFSVLKVSDEKIRDKMISAVYERVTSIRHEGLDINLDDLLEALKDGFIKALGGEVMITELTKEEMLLAEELEREKYSTKEWNFKR